MTGTNEKPPRHRPGTAVLPKGRIRMEAILDAATTLLIDDGYAHLSTRKIAARAGIRPGHLQYYYPTKQDVVRGLLERYLERASLAFEREAATAPDAEGRVDLFLDAVLRDQREGDRARFFWELWALAARDGAIADAMHAFYRTYWRRLVDALLGANPALGRPRAERRAALLIATLEGLTLFRSRGASRELPLPFLERELRELACALASDAG
ncbi:MAG: TetR/AcrR family transcriptional regulator [Deltaproteobacteria bacterium]|nr:TetR/AcrR family transcriptional regulator [Deltaproteobacteria bacterium]